MQYDTLLGYLLDLCQNSGVEIKFGVKVTSVELRPQARPVVVTVSGERIEADVVGRSSSLDPELNTELVSL